MSLKTDYKDAVLASGTLRKYQKIDNDDDTVSFRDVSQYSQAGDKGQASVFNATNKEVNVHTSDQTVHIAPLTCTTSGTVHALTGLSASSGLASCVFKADADYAEGDTFTVDGTAYTVVTSGGESLRAGAFLSGGIVSVELDVDNKALHIRQDAGAKALTVSQGYGGEAGTYDGSATKSVSVPKITFHTSEPGTVAVGELWAVY